MPVYLLFRGDCNHLAHLQEAGKPPFVATDAMGREWLCVETDMPEIGAGLPDAAVEMMAAQRAAHLKGLSNEGSESRLMDCPDEEVLRRRLIEDAEPPVAELQARLALAGWTLVRFAWGTGQPFRLTLGKGATTFTVEGETEQKAWRHATQEKLTMNLTIHDAPVPLRKDADGAVRVGDSRVPLAVVVLEFLKGASPEGIVHAYPTLQLADVYAVVSYYLRNREDVHGYLLACEDAAQRLRQEIEAKQPGRAELKARLLARKAEMELEHASPGK